MSSEGFEPPSNPTQTDHDTRLHYELIIVCVHGLNRLHKLKPTNMCGLVFKGSIEIY